MFGFDLGSVAERVTLTPAERAVLVEQAETLKADLDAHITACKDGTPKEVVSTYTKALQTVQYASELLGHKVQAVLMADHESGREH